MSVLDIVQVQTDQMTDDQLDAFRSVFGIAKRLRPELSYYVAWCYRMADGEFEWMGSHGDISFFIVTDQPMASDEVIKACEKKLEEKE